MNKKDPSRKELLQEIATLKKEISKLQKTADKDEKLTFQHWNDLPLPLIIYDEEKIYYYNKRAAQLLHIKKNTPAKSVTIYQHIAAESKLVVKKMNQDVLTGKAYIEGEFKLENKETHQKHIHALLKPVLFQGKKVIQAVWREVSSQKQLINDFEITKSNFNLILDNIDEIVYYYDAIQNQVLYISQQIEKVMGISPRSYIQNPDIIIKQCHPEDLSNIYSEAGRMMESRKPVTCYYRVKHIKSKKYIWIEERIFPQYNAKKVYIGSLGVSRDITRDKENEIRIKESEEKYRLLAEQANDIIFKYRFNPEVSCTYMSSSVKKILGYQIKSFYDDPAFINKIVVPEDQQVMIDFGNTATLKKSKVKFQQVVVARVKTSKKNTIWLETRFTPIWDQQGNLYELQGISRDITQQKQYEAELNQQWANYKAVIDHSPNGILILQEGKVIFANPAAIKISGFDSYEKLQQVSVFEHLLPKYRSIAEERANKAFKGELLTPFEYEIKNGKGELMEIEVKSSFINFNGQKSIQIIINNLSSQKQLEREIIRAQIAEETNKKLGEEIEQRIKTEDQLRQTQNYLRLIIDSSLDMICASDKEGRITEFNYAAQKTFGYSLKEVMGKPISILFSDTIYQSEVYKKLVIGNYQYSGEIYNKKKNGEVFICFLSASALKDEHGEVIGTMGVSRDITELKRNEQQLIEQAGKLRAIFESGTQNMWTVNRNLELTSFNKNYADMVYDFYGIHPELGKPLERPAHLITTQEFNILWDGKIEQAFNGHSIEFATERMNREGKKKFRQVYLHPIYDENNHVTEVSCIAYDMTELRYYEQENLKQTAKLKAIFDSGSQMIWSFDKNFNVISSNKNFNKIFKLNNGDNLITSESFVHHINLDTKEKPVKFINAFKGISQQFEIRMNDTADQAFWAEVFLEPIYDKKGKVYEVSGIAHNITHRKLAEEEIKRSLKEKEVLLKEVHHRVKNNLQVISSILNLQSTYLKDEQTQNLLKECQHRIKSMAFIHEALYQTKDFSQINFSEYVVMLVKNLIHSYGTHNTRIKTRFEVENLFLNLDTSIPCGLIVNELVSNALKYAFPDNREGNIFVNLRSEKETATLIVADNGIGLPPAIDYRNTESLGLQLVVTLVEQIDGRMELVTEKGTKFIIKFKLR